MVVDGEGRWCLIHSSVGVTQSMIIMSVKPSHGGRSLIKTKPSSLLGSGICWLLAAVRGEMLSFGWRPRVQVSVSATTGLIEVLLNKTLNLKQQRESCSAAGSDLWTPGEEEGSEKEDFPLVDHKYQIIRVFLILKMSLVMPNDIMSWFAIQAMKWNISWWLFIHQSKI